MNNPVDFLICGAQKAGTSALDAYCRRHDDLRMAHIKEVHFFDADAEFAAGEPDYPAYHARFPAAESGKRRGESTPVYMYWPCAPQRIHAYNPAMKLIAILRNPVERAYSHWQMETRRGHESLPFGEAVRQEARRLLQADPDHRRAWSYIDRGRYLEQLTGLWDLFGRDQVLVLRHETLRDKPAEVLNAVSEFLGIGPFPVVPNLSVNTQGYDSAMAEADRRFLQDVFAEDISALETALDWDLELWRRHD